MANFERIEFGARKASELAKTLKELSKPVLGFGIDYNENQKLKSAFKSNKDYYPTAYLISENENVVGALIATSYKNEMDVSLSLTNVDVAKKVIEDFLLNENLDNYKIVRFTLDSEAAANIKKEFDCVARKMGANLTELRFEKEVAIF